MNYLSLKIALQNLLSRRNSSFMSILGLAIAFTSVFYIYSYITFELGYDSQHKKAERIYRLSGDLVAAENTMTHALIGPSMGPQLQSEFPIVEAYTRLFPIRQSISLETGEDKFLVKEAYEVDHAIFEIFSLEVVYGDEASALTQPNQIVINQSLCNKMFGNLNPVGKTIKYNEELYMVCAVVKDSPENSHHKLNVLLSLNKTWFNQEGMSEGSISEKFWMPSAYLFVLLSPNSEIESITENFDSFFNTHMAKFGKQINAKFTLVPTILRNLHFSPHMSYDYPKGNKTYSYILIAIVIFILSIACINYSNLLISQNNIQSKSVGVRKIFGASRVDLIKQFLLNSFTIVLSSLLLALFFFTLTLPQIEKLTNINSSAFSNSNLFLLSVILVLATVLFTSVILYFNQLAQSGFNMEQSKQNILSKKSGFQFGKTSTIIQYALTTILLISVIIISRQINFLIDHDMGFDKENVLMIKVKGTKQALKFDAFKSELRKNSNILKVSSSSHVPGEVLGSMHLQIKRGGQKVTKIFNGIGVDYDYISLMGMELKEGRDFKKELNDGNYRSVIVNEALVDYCAFEDSVVGRKIEQTTVVGVLKNISFNSLHTPGEPLVLYLSEEPRGYINIKISSLVNQDEALHSIKETWLKFFGDAPIDYQFLDNRVAMLYEEDQNKNILFKLCTVVSIIITIMGLLNICILSMQRKIKEIGVRKVNGAKIHEIMAMLTKDFVKWVAISFIIACPVAWYAMHKWLENFAYKTELNWWVFALAGLIAMGIALLTVSFQSWRTATRNPVESLRYE
jgi:putative ABC transport system permease protein